MLYQEKIKTLPARFELPDKSPSIFSGGSYIKKGKVGLWVWNKELKVRRSASGLDSLYPKLPNSIRQAPAEKPFSAFLQLEQEIIQLCNNILDSIVACQVFYFNSQTKQACV